VSHLQPLCYFGYMQNWHFSPKSVCKRFSSNNLTFLSGDSTTVCHISLHICRSGNFPIPQILTAVSIKWRL